MGERILGFVNEYPFYFMEGSFIILSLLSFIAVKFFKIQIYTLIIVVGTFALAVAFAGNDLVNFIGVPIAAFNSYEIWSASGVLPSDFAMTSLECQPVATEPFLLLIAGLIMVLTLWFSTKARAVVKTSVDLSSQDEGKERFEPNFLSRNIVRLSIGLSESISKNIPKSFQTIYKKQFRELKKDPTVKAQDAPAFDLIRASVNLMVASVLISIATSMKLPFQQPTSPLWLPWEPPCRSCLGK